MSTLCPHCEKEMVLMPNGAHGSVMAYGKPNTVLAKCCGNFVTISAQVSYAWSYYKNDNPYQYIEGSEIIHSDDWGNEKRVSK